MLDLNNSYERIAEQAASKNYLTRFDESTDSAAARGQLMPASVKVLEIVSAVRLRSAGRTLGGLQVRFWTATAVLSSYAVC